VNNKKIPVVNFKISEDLSEGAKDKKRTPPEICQLRRWITKSSKDLFEKKKVIVFSLPGAFTPTCSTQQLPGFDNNYQEFKKLGIDEIYCVSVNDTFVMNAWCEYQNVKNIKMIPDGNAQFTQKMGMLVNKDDKGFGKRSWRYAMIVNNCIIEKLFEEKGKADNLENDPYEASSPENLLKFLKNN
jgi:thioredoxin-dependent peroxiredoxin